MSKYEEINDALDIEVSNTPENGCVKIKPNKPDVSEKIKKNYDYPLLFCKTNIIETLNNIIKNNCIKKSLS